MSPALGLDPTPPPNGSCRAHSYLLHADVLVTSRSGYSHLAAEIGDAMVVPRDPPRLSSNIPADPTPTLLHPNPLLYSRSCSHSLFSPNTGTSIHHTPTPTPTPTHPSLTHTQNKTIADGCPPGGGD